MKDESVGIVMGKELLSASCCSPKSFSTGSCACYIWDGSTRNVTVGIDSLISSVLHCFGVSSVLWGESCVRSLSATTIPVPGLPETLGGLQGLCSAPWSACNLPLLVCLYGKRNLLEAVILEKTGHLGQSKDFFLKKSASILWLEIRILDSYWSHVSFWCSWKDRFRVC